MGLRTEDVLCFTDDKVIWSKFVILSFTNEIWHGLPPESVSDLSNAFVAEREQIPAEKTLVESLPRTVETD